MEITQKHISRKNVIFHLIRHTANPGIDFTNPWIDGTVIKWSGIPISRDLKSLIINSVPRAYSNIIIIINILLCYTRFSHKFLSWYTFLSPVFGCRSFRELTFHEYCDLLYKRHNDLIVGYCMKYSNRGCLQYVLNLNILPWWVQLVSLFLGERRISQLNYFFFLKTSVVSMCQMWAVI